MPSERVQRQIDRLLDQAESAYSAPYGIPLWNCNYLDLRYKGERMRTERAMAKLDEAPAISTQLRMRPLMEWVLSRREILKV